MCSTNVYLFILRCTGSLFKYTVGQWNFGKMEGVGILQSKNGEVYQGSFVNNLYEGIGSYKRATGDIYMG